MKYEFLFFLYDICIWKSYHRMIIILWVSIERSYWSSETMWLNAVLSLKFNHISHYKNYFFPFRSSYISLSTKKNILKNSILTSSGFWRHRNLWRQELTSSWRHKRYDVKTWPHFDVIKMWRQNLTAHLLIFIFVFKFFFTNLALV